MADAAGSAVTAPAHVLETYLSRWEAGHVAISARYRQLLDAVLGASAPAVPPVSMPPGPRKWMRAMRAIESGIADGQWKPGGRLPGRPALAQRYGLSVDAVMRAQDELLRAGALRTGPVHGALYVSDAQDQQPPGTPLPAAPGPAGRGGGKAVSPPARAADRGAGDAAPAARNPRAYARPDTRVPAVPAAPADAGTEPGKAPARSPASGELPPGDGLPEFMLVRECAAQIRVSSPAIHDLIKQGHIEAVRVGRDFRIYTRSWLAYLHAPRPGPRPQPEGDGQRDHPPQTAGPPAQPQPEPAGGAGPGAPPVVFRAPA
jgi:excisionase family DNA binding protein